MKRTCENCTAFAPTGGTRFDTAGTLVAEGTCRAEPPKFGGWHGNRWPLALANEWCRQFVAVGSELPPFDPNATVEWAADELPATLPLPLPPQPAAPPAAEYDGPILKFPGVT